MESASRVRWLKISTVLVLFSIAVLTLFRSSAPVNQNPFLWTRYAILQYNLYPGSLPHRPGLMAKSFPTVIVSGSNILVSWNQYPVLASLLSSLSVVLGVPLRDVIIVPIIPIGGLFAGFLFFRALTDHNGLGLLGGTIVGLRYTFPVSHPIPKPFGQYVLLLFFGAVFLWYLSGRVKRRASFLVPTFYTVIVLAVPKTSVVALVFIVVFTGLICLGEYVDTDQLSCSRYLANLAIFGSVVFLLYNPKLYQGVVGGLITPESAVAVFSTNGEIQILENLLSVFSSASTHPLMLHPAGVPRTTRLLNYAFFLILIALIVGWGLSIFSRRNWAELRRNEAVFLVAIGLASFVHVGYRLALLRRFSPVFLYFTVLMVGIYSLSRLENRRLVKGAIVLMILLSVATSSSVAIHNWSGERIYEAPTDATANWAAERVPGDRIFTDHHTYSELLYSYTINGEPKPSQRVVFRRYTIERYEALIDIQRPPGNYDVFIIDKTNLNQPLKKGSNWRWFVPLEPYVEGVETNPHLRKTYSNGYHDVYQPMQ